MSDVVDLRSDTVTRPTPAMRRAMAEAEVGDDDYGEDPTVRALEEAFAERVGKPAALFVASGVMANQVAVRVLSSPGTAVVAGRRQHVVAYEYGAAALNSGVQFIALDDADGMLRADDVRGARQASEHHQPAVSLVCIENTHMAASGAPWTLGRPARAGGGGGAGARPHGRGPPLQRRGRHRGGGGRMGGRRRPRSCAACPRGCARRWARCWPAPRT